MSKLEDLTPNAAVRGILPNSLITVVNAQWFGSEALELTYKTPEGKVANELLYRHDEARIEVVEQGRPWSFDGDGSLFRLVSEAHRIRLAHLFDPVLAVHDGYFSTVGCIEFPHGGQEGTMQYKPGGMGVHFLNVQLIGPALDPAKPQVLIYEPDGDKLRLVAAEWFVPVEAAGQTRPAIFGKELEGPMEGHHPLMPAGLHHYDLHVWLWKANPAGTFSPTNPALKCPKQGYSFEEAAPKLVDRGH